MQRKRSLSIYIFPICRVIFSQFFHSKTCRISSQFNYCAPQIFRAFAAAVSWIFVLVICLDSKNYCKSCRAVDFPSRLLNAYPSVANDFTRHSISQIVVVEMSLQHKVLFVHVGYLFCVQTAFIRYFPIACYCACLLNDCNLVGIRYKCAAGKSLAVLSPYDACFRLIKVQRATIIFCPMLFSAYVPAAGALIASVSVCAAHKLLALAFRVFVVFQFFPCAGKDFFHISAVGVLSYDTAVVIWTFRRRSARPQSLFVDNDSLVIRLAHQGNAQHSVAKRQSLLLPSVLFPVGALCPFYCSF